MPTGMRPAAAKPSSMKASGSAMKASTMKDSATKASSMKAATMRASTTKASAMKAGSAMAAGGQSSTATSSAGAVASKRASSGSSSLKPTKALMLGPAELDSELDGSHPAVEAILFDLEDEDSELEGGAWDGSAFDETSYLEGVKERVVGEISFREIRPDDRVQVTLSTWNPTSKPKFRSPPSSKYEVVQTIINA